MTQSLAQRTFDYGCIYSDIMACSKLIYHVSMPILYESNATRLRCAPYGESQLESCSPQALSLINRTDLLFSCTSEAVSHGLDWLFALAYCPNLKVPKLILLRVSAIHHIYSQDTSSTTSTLQSRWARAHTLQHFNHMFREGVSTSKGVGPS